MTRFLHKKIAWLITTMGYGSNLLYWEPLLRGYIDHFPETRVFTNGKKEPTGSSPLPIEDAVSIYRIPLGLRPRTYPRNILVIGPSIIAKALKFRPDLLILSEFGMLTVFGMVVTLLSPNCRILLLIESDSSKFSSRASAPYRAWFRRLLCKRCTLFLTNNIAGSRYLQDVLRVPEQRIIQSCYLVSEPPPRPDSDTGDSTLAAQLIHERHEYIAFLYVGQLHPRKGLQVLLDSLVLLPKDALEHVQIWIVGDGDERPRLSRFVKENHLELQVRFFGAQPYSEIGMFYHNADVFVFPTLHDYRALVGFEAIGYGLPMLHSCADGAVSEVVIEGKNGFSFDPDDVGELASRIKWFVNNADKIPGFSQYSREIASRYTIDSAVKTLVHATASALDTDGRSVSAGGS
jgi:glycosyltransferase involved in cell wall biosynthesis